MATDSSISESLHPYPNPHPEPDPSNLPESELPPSTSPISLSFKGKALMEEPSSPAELNCDDDDGGEGDSYSQAPSCGICLSEEGRAVRGCIDSCNHYFCFRCIIDWSKIESRCPLCKRRFGTIRRMRTDGSVIGDRDVIVPLRNQIYDPQRNTTSRPVNPYSNISCSTCACSTDENLLLLCDLCDTAIHTYCAGLGATIPEGDWFCQECALMKAEELNSEPTTDLDTEKLPVQAPISIFDIVRGAGEPNPEAVRHSVSFTPQQQPSPSSVNALPRQARQNVRRRSETNVSRLDRCRDAHTYIRGLRENWNAIRSGSLSFPSRNFESGSINKSMVNSTSHGSNGSSHGDTSNKKNPYDVDRAWKMFNIAKSKQTKELSGTSSSTSMILSVSSSKDSNKLCLGVSSKIVPSKTKNNAFTGLKMHQTFKKQDGCGSKGSGQHNNAIFGREEARSSNTCLTAVTHRKCGSSYNNTAQNPIKSDVFCGRVVMLSQAKPHVYQEQGFSSCTKLPAGSLTGASSLSSTKSQKKTASFDGCSSQTIDSDTKHTSDSNLLHKSAKKMRDAEEMCISSLTMNTQKSIKSDVFCGRAVMSSQAMPGEGLPHANHVQGFSSCRKLLARPLTGAFGLSCTKLQRKTAALNFEGCSGQSIDSDTKYTCDSSQLQKSFEKVRKVEDMHKSSSNKNMQLIKNDFFHGKAVMPSQAMPCQGLPHHNHEEVLSSCTKSLARPLAGASGFSCTKLQQKPASLNFEECSSQTIDTDTKHTSESNPLPKSGEKRRNAEDIGGGSKRIKVVDPEAKCEIQSLVKLNLKLLSAGKRLEVDLFKDIARRSTHDILAACGLEPPKHNKIPIPKPVCSHGDQNKQQIKSSLMPGSCRECFFAYVKEVVGSVMSQKVS